MPEEESLWVAKADQVLLTAVVVDILHLKGAAVVLDSHHRMAEVR